MSPHDERREREIISRWALRFRGWDYVEETGFDHEAALRALMHDGQMPRAIEESFCCFFLLQRHLFKWGGESLPGDSREWRALRSLFLTVAGWPVPVRWRSAEHHRAWARLPAAKRLDDVRFVYRVHAGTAYAAGHQKGAPLPERRPSRDLIEAWSWRLATELTRRCPTGAKILETHPCSGQYDCLDVTLSPAGGAPVTIAFNRHGTAHVFPARGERIRWPDVWERAATAESLRPLLDELCALAGLTVPARLPPSTPATLTWRVMAAAIEALALSPGNWRLRSGVEISDFGRTRDEFYAAFDGGPALPSDSEESRFDTASVEWFLCTAERPVLRFDTANARCWLADGEPARDLRAAYGEARSIGRVAFSLLGRLGT